MKNKVFLLMPILILFIVSLVGFGEYYYTGQQLQSLVEQSMKLADPAAAITEALKTQHMRMAMTTGIILFILISATALLQLSMIMKHIKKLSDSAEEISVGQLAIKAHSSGFAGPIGSHINKVVKNLKTILCEINKISEQNKTLADTLSKSVEHTDRASGEIANAITDVANNTGEQSKSLIKAKQSTGIMTSNSLEIAQKAKETQMIANQMIEVIQDSGVVFNNLTEKLKNTANVSVGIAGKVQQLYNEADKIKNIVTTVTEISERTNLLALNAAIEAARAGEHGKGFAVVSDEVRKLAEQSARSSEEIRHLIQNIIESIHDITQKTQLEVTRINEDIQFADQSKNTFVTVAQTTKSTYDSVQHIYELAEQSTALVEQVNHLMDNVAASAEETVAFTEEVSASAQEQSAAMQETAELIRNMKDIANSIDARLYEFISKIKVTGKQEALVKEGLAALKNISAEIINKKMSFNEISPYLQEQQKRNKQFEFVGLFNDKGRLTTATDMAAVTDTDYSFRPYFKEAIKGAEFKSEPYISTYSYNYCISVSIPYKDAAGRIIGVVVADICIED